MSLSAASHFARPRVFGSLAISFALSSLAVGAFGSAMHNDRYALSVEKDGAVTIEVEGMPAQRLVPEFTVIRSETDPDCKRDASHPNYVVAPRTAVR